jgi:O-antigen/teichoic acid export membrane protein
MGSSLLVKLFAFQWLKINRLMLFNAASLVATFVVKSGFGFAYWWVAARQFPPSSVGFASAAVSTMTLLGTLCMLGLGTLLIRELPRQPGHESSLISAALLLVAAAGAFIGVLFALSMPSFSSSLLPLRANLFSTLIFAVGVSISTVNLVLDQVLLGLLWGGLQLWRNLLFAGAKLVLLTVVGLWFSHHSGLTIYVTWTLGDIFSLLALAVFVFSKRKWNGRISVPQWSLLRKLGRPALQHHFLNLLLILPNYALPILVTVLISATANAWFYVAFLIADIAYVVPQSLVVALYAISSSQPEILARRTRLTILLAVAAGLLANIVLFFAAPLLLNFFGSGYAQQGLWSLRILSIGAIPFLIKDLYVAISRIEDRIPQTLLPLSCAAILELGLSIFGAHFYGVTGLSLGWFLAVCIEAIFMSRKVYTIASSDRHSAQQLSG